MDPASIRALASERSRADRAGARWLILLGIPFAGVSWFVLTSVVWLISSPLCEGGMSTRSFLVSAGIVLAILVIDCWRHPSPHFIRARYYVVGQGLVGPELNGARVLSPLAGMPRMASVSDPGNVAMQFQVMANGCSNVALGGPRNIREGIERLLLARRRTTPAVLASAAAFLEWLEREGEAGEARIAEMLAGRSDLGAGYALARELALIRLMRTEKGEVFRPA